MSNTDFVYTSNALIGKETFSKIIVQHITTEVYLNFVSKIERKSLESKKMPGKQLLPSTTFYCLLSSFVWTERQTIIYFLSTKPSLVEEYEQE